MSQSFDTPGNPEPAKKSILPTCLLSCLVLFIIMLIGGAIGAWYLVKKGPAMLARAGGNAMIETVRQSDMPEEEKTKVITQIERLQGAVERGEVGLADLEKVATEFAESPLMGIAMVQFVQQKYINPSGLAEEEKSEGIRTLQRVARGIYEKSLTFDQLDSAMALIADKDASGNWQLKNSVDDNSLRQFLAECKSLSDGASVPDEEFAVSVGDELQKVIDDILAGKGQ